jgi:phosphoribosylanthranilate isomerase
VWIKICGLTTIADVEHALEAGADGIGVVLAPGSPRTVNDEQSQTLLRAMQGSQALSIAVVGAMDRARLAEVARLGFDVVQWVVPPSLATPSDVLAVLPVLFDGADLEARHRAWRPTLTEISRSANWPRTWPEAGLVNIDSGAGGESGTPADWQRVARLAEKHPVMLAGGLRPDNVAAAIAQVGPFAVDVSSGVETTPGRKDAARIRDFVVEARRASAARRQQI